VEYLLAAGAEVNRQNKVRLYSSMFVGAAHRPGIALDSIIQRHFIMPV
jgi:hypothetical protein